MKRYLLDIVRMEGDCKAKCVSFIVKAFLTETRNVKLKSKLLWD
jgi:hypothetical protein